MMVYIYIFTYKCVYEYIQVGLVDGTQAHEQFRRLIHVSIYVYVYIFTSIYLDAYICKYICVYEYIHC